MDGEPQELEELVVFLVREGCSWLLCLCALRASYAAPAQEHCWKIKECRESEGEGNANHDMYGRAGGLNPHLCCLFWVQDPAHGKCIYKLEMEGPDLWKISFAHVERSDSTWLRDLHKTSGDSNLELGEKSWKSWLKLRILLCCWGWSK